MALHLLFRSAAIQLRGLLQQGVHCLSATARGHQSSQGRQGNGKKNDRKDKTDDDSKTKPRKEKINEDSKTKPSTVSSGPAFLLLERDIQTIIEKEQHQWQEKVTQERSSLQQRIDLLVSLGCNIDQIQDRLEILKYPETEILKRAAMLKEHGRSPITVNLLMLAKHSVKKQLIKHLELSDSLDDAICSVLQCSIQELNVLKAKHKSLTRFRAVQAKDIRKCFEILQSFGVTSEEVKACPQVLNVKAQNLQKKLEELKELKEKGMIVFDKYPLPLLTACYSKFNTSIKRIIAQRVEIDGTKIKLETISSRLGVEASDLKAAIINFHKINPTCVLAKLDYLLAAGVTSVDILSHIYILRNSLASIKEAVEKAKSVSMGNSPNMFIILSFLRCKRLPKKSFVYSRQRLYISCLLQTPITSFPPSSAALRPLWSTQRHVIKHNFDFLTSKGFDVATILSCLIVLAHDPPILQSYYAGLWSRPEVAPHKHSQVWLDKKRTLALLQYLMEKDMNFTSTVFHADVEYEHGALPPSLQVHKSPVAQCIKDTSNSDCQQQSDALSSS